MKHRLSLSLSLSQQTAAGNVVEFMSAVTGVHSHYHQLISELFSSHKLFFSALDRVRQHCWGREGGREEIISN